MRFSKMGPLVISGRRLLLAMIALNAMASLNASWINRAAGDDYALQMGAQHVGFTLPAIDDGRPVSLEQFRGKKVLLIQFASW